MVLVTTRNLDGTSNVAPKSWISMMAFRPAILAIGCNRGHWTARNALRDREFVVNIPGADLADAVWESHRLPHPRPVEAAGWTTLPSRRVHPPRIRECRAHLECVLDRSVRYGDEVVLFGRIVAVSVDREVATARDPYRAMRPFVYLERGAYGIINRTSRTREFE